MPNNPVVIVPPLVGLAEAKAHLRRTDTADDTDIAVKLQEANDAVLDWLGLAADAAWTPATTPTPVKQAIKLRLTHVYQNRGENLEMDMANWDAINRLLFRFRDPTFA